MLHCRSQCNGLEEWVAVGCSVRKISQRRHERGKGIGGFNNKDIGVTLTFNIDVSSFANSLNEQIQACPGGVTLKIQLSERMMSKIAHG